jgi:hypothetical protein
MATLIQFNGPMIHSLPVPISLNQFQQYCGGFIDFIEMNSGHTIFVLNENQSELPYNLTASSMAAQALYGDVVVCAPKDIA